MLSRSCGRRTQFSLAAMSRAQIADILVEVRRTQFLNGIVRIEGSGAIVPEMSSAGRQHTVEQDGGSLGRPRK